MKGRAGAKALGSALFVKVLSAAVILPAFFVFLFFFPAAAGAEGSLLKEGMRGSDVAGLQLKLKALGYYCGETDGVFGPVTRSAVESFQRASGLWADGIAGPQTLRALELACEGTSRQKVSGSFGVLKSGSYGAEVVDLQKRLKELGYYGGPVDGDFGPATQRAVMLFQSDFGLAVDGVAGSETLGALAAAGRTYPPSRGAAAGKPASSAVSLARQYLGVPYVWGGAGPGGFDCSGFVYYIFGRCGIDLPRAADGQFYGGIPVDRPEPGDLVFFSTYEPGPSHVGIYLGGGDFIHASSGAGCVTITPMSDPFYRARYLGARRYTR